MLPNYHPPDQGETEGETTLDQEEKRGEAIPDQGETEGETTPDQGETEGETTPDLGKKEGETGRREDINKVVGQTGHTDRQMDGHTTDIGRQTDG